MMMHFRNLKHAARAILGALAALCGATTWAQGAPSYTIEDLGVLAGDDEAVGLAVNGSGQAVGRSKPTGGFFRAVRWTTATPVDLATIIGQQTSTANGINDAGHIALLSGFTAPGSVVGTTAHFWNGTTLTNLGKLGTGQPSGGVASIANDVNNGDEVVGKAWSSAGSTGFHHPFRWKNGVMSDLAMPADCNQGEVYDINGNGQMIGIAFGTGSCSNQVAIAWANHTSTGVILNEALAAAGITASVRYSGGLNDSGVMHAQVNASAQLRCVIITAAPNVTLTTVPWLGTETAQSGCIPGRINNLGEAVGTQDNNGTGQVDQAFLYSGGVIYDLNALVDAATRAQWQLLEAYDINDGGTIVGKGSIGGKLHAFRAVRAPTSGGGLTVEDSIAPFDDHSLPFGTVTIGIGTIGTVTVLNGTGAPAAVDITESPVAPFGIADPGDCKVTLPAGGSCTITVTFDPTTTTAASGSLTLSLAGTPQAVNLSGTGRQPTFTVSDSIAPADDRLVPFGSSVQAGGSGSATVTVRNTDNIPATLALTQDLPGGSPFRLQNAAACNVTLAPDQTCVLTVLFEPVAVGSYSETFKVSAGGGSEQTVTVTGSPGSPGVDLQISQAVDRPVLQPGTSGSDTATITLTLKNNGPDAGIASVADVLPAGLTYVGSSASQGAYDSSTGSWSVGSLASGASATLAITARATASATDCLSNTATATVASPAVDPLPGNDSTTLWIGAPACADVMIGLTEVRDRCDVSGNCNDTIGIRHEVTVTNRGPGVAEAVVLNWRDYLFEPRPNTSEDSLPASSGSVPIGTLAPGESRVVTVVAYQVDASGSDVQVTYTLELETATTDPDESNNQKDGGYPINRKTRGSPGCFIATAAYGSYLEPQVMVLRQFRDRVLLQFDLGRTFVAWYYRISPPIADWIRDREWARTITRGLLTPLVYGLGHPVGGIAILVLCLALLRRRARTTGQPA